MKRYVTWICAAVALPCMLAPVLIGAQQSPAEPDGTLHVSTRLVVLDVRVVDRNGHFVKGLDRSQFEVYEDAQPQRIKSFESPADRMTLSPGTALVRSTADLFRVGSRAVDVIVIDELNTTFADVSRAQQAIRRFLEAQPETLRTPTLFLASGASSKGGRRYRKARIDS